MEALVKHREQCGVLNSNVYFFAMPSSHGYVNGWQVMERVARDASLSKPKLIHSNWLRKYAATVTQVLSKTYTGMVVPEYFKDDDKSMGNPEISLHSLCKGQKLSPFFFYCFTDSQPHTLLLLFNKNSATFMIWGTGIRELMRGMATLRKVTRSC